MSGMTLTSIVDASHVSPGQRAAAAEGNAEAQRDLSTSYNGRGGTAGVAESRSADLLRAVSPH